MKVGIECEGIYSGTKTLLITREEFENTHLNDICDVATSNSCTNIYVGADQTITKFDTMLSIESLLNLRNLWPHLITVEMPVEFLQNYGFRKNSALKNVRFIITIKAQIEDLHPLDMIKVESDDNCYLAPLYSFYKNEKNYLDTVIKNYGSTPMEEKGISCSSEIDFYETTKTPKSRVKRKFKDNESNEEISEYSSGVNNE